MDFEDIAKLYRNSKDTTCNCPWMHCPEHPSALCKNMAGYIQCPDEDCPTKEHFLGDQSLGDGIHLCHKCGAALLAVLQDEVPAIMGEVEPYIPKHMRPINQLIKKYYKARFGTGGWEMPYVDAYGVLALANDTVQRDKTVPLPIVLRLCKVASRVTDIMNAFQPSDESMKNLSVKEVSE